MVSPSSRSTAAKSGSKKTGAQKFGPLANLRDDATVAEIAATLAPIQERANELEAQPELVSNIIDQGCEAAREVARQTMDEVRQVMSLVYR